MRELAETLGPLGWYEAQLPARDIWYVNLVHFAGPIADPDGLLAWVAANRSIPPVEFVVPSVELVTFKPVADGVQLSSR